MVEAVRRVTPHFEGVVEWREHAIKRMEAVTFMSSLMVKNIPTICIDGKIAFVSKIPPQNVLIQAIQQRVNEKLKLKIKSKRSEILVLGESAAKCKPMLEKLQRAITELGKDIPVNVVTDPNQLGCVWHNAQSGSSYGAIPVEVRRRRTFGGSGERVGKGVVILCLLVSLSPY
jgi:hypothetical protein